MKITFDHNCIIDALESDSPSGREIRSIVAERKFDCAVTDLGASEMRQLGIRPDRYDLFEQLLVDAGMDSLTRLQPMMIWNVTFWNRCTWADTSMSTLAKEIEKVLFPSGLGAAPCSGLDSPPGKKWLNKLCDVHTIWCHIYNDRDIFVTNDKNFMKATKCPKLIRLGAKKIARPADLLYPTVRCS